MYFRLYALIYSSEERTKYIFIYILYNRTENQAAEVFFMHYVESFAMRQIRMLNQAQLYLFFH